MRTKSEYDQCIALKDQNYNNCQIAKMTNIPRETIKTWFKNGFQPKFKLQERLLNTPIIIEEFLKNKEPEYAFILGFYLGDGYINGFKNRNTQKLRLYNDSKYPILNDLILKSLRSIFPNRKSYIYKQKQHNCCEISVYDPNLSIIFPQHGKGKKHERKIELNSLQENIVSNYPKEFLRGLLMSDGCRYVSNGYIMYQFTNKSKDLINIFIKYASLLGLKTRIVKKPDGSQNVFITTRNSVNILETFVGPKN